ncbi:MAG: acyl-CoA dehydrogenase family protein [Mycobacteriaceae bacterium]
MDFTLDSEQEAVAEVTRNVLRESSSAPQAGAVSDLAVVHKSWHQELWQTCVDAGLTNLLVPKHLGGDGLDISAAAIVLTECGRHAVNLPMLATLGFGVLPVLALGSDSHIEEIVGPVSTGKILTAAVNEPSDPMPSSPKTVAVREGSGFVINGKKIAVLHAPQAYRMLVTTSAGIFVLNPKVSGVGIAKAPSSGSDEYTVTFRDVRVDKSQFLVEDVQVLHQCMLASLGAFSSGLFAGAMDLTAQHLATRVQFGRPLATFQAVSQQIADIYVSTRTMHLLATSAAWRLSRQLNAADDLNILAYWLAEEGPIVMQHCHHLHGGVGVDSSYPLHRYYSLAKDLARFVGGASFRLEHLGAQCILN